MNYFTLETTFNRCNIIYANTCESIARTAYGFWNTISIYLPFRLPQNERVSQIESFMLDKGLESVQGIKSKEKSPLIPLELSHSIEEIKGTLFPLSEAFNTVFKTDVIFWRPPGPSENQLIINKFFRKLNQENLSAKEKKAAKIGIAACFEVAKFNEKVEELFPNQYVSYDQLKKCSRGQKFYGSIKNNLKPALHENVIENLAEFCGQIVAEVSLFHLASLIQSVGRPIGRFSGLVIGHFIIQSLIRTVIDVMHLNKGSTWEKRMHMGLFSLYLLLDSVGYNPITQVFEAMSGEICEQFVSYSTLILSGYLGMWIVGTKEPLREYVINTNRSVFISSLAVPVLEKAGLVLGQASSIPLSMMGLILQQREIVRLTSGHLVYHYEFYKDCTQKMTKLCMKGYERKLIHHFFDIYFDIRSEWLEWMIQIVKIESSINPVPFFYRNMVEFFSLIRTPEMQTLLKNYREEIVTALNRSETIHALDRAVQQPLLNNRLRMKKQILRQIDQHIFSEEVNAWMAEVIFNVSDFFKTGPRVIEKLEKTLDSLYPFIPIRDTKEEIVFGYLIDVLVIGMIYFNFVKVFEVIRGRERSPHLEDCANVFTFLARAKDFGIDMRFPIHRDQMSLYLTGVRGAINVALHLAYPT